MTCSNTLKKSNKFFTVIYCGQSGCYLNSPSCIRLYLTLVRLWVYCISNETVTLAFPFAALRYNLCEIQMYLFSSKELPWDTKSRLMNLNMLDQVPVHLSGKPKFHYLKKLNPMYIKNTLYAKWPCLLIIPESIAFAWQAELIGLRQWNNELAVYLVFKLIFFCLYI